MTLDAQTNNPSRATGEMSRACARESGCLRAAQAEAAPAMAPQGGGDALLLVGRSVPQGAEGDGAPDRATDAPAMPAAWEDGDSVGGLLEVAVHELRNPLCGVSGLLELLATNLRSEKMPNPEAIELLETAQGEVQRLTGILGRVLDTARGGGIAASNRQEPCDLRDVLRSAVRPLLRGTHPIILESDEPGPVPLLADRSRLEQVFCNLLGNAVKYSPPASLIRIKLHRAIDTVQVTVQDQGPGIPAGETEHIFERFYRASNVRDGDSDGAGLGLYVCREIVTAHGGTIWAEPGRRGGALLHVSLPLRTGDAWHAF